MFATVAIIVCAITLILLKFLLNIKFSKIKELKYRNTDGLEKFGNKFQDDEKICKEILKMLNNSDVKIKMEPEYSSCLYMVFNNTITIGKFQQNYMKLQTIAHECIHSCQNKTTLGANFIISNIYLLYFIVILILEFLNNLPFANIHIMILVFLSFIQYIIRITLENEAMIKAKYVAKEYIEHSNILDKDETNKLLIEYDEVNNIGIPFMSFYLIANNLIKVIIFSLLVLI